MHSLNRGESPVITVRLPDDLVSWLNRESRDYGISRSQLLRQIIRESKRRIDREGAR